MRTSLAAFFGLALSLSAEARPRALEASRPPAVSSRAGGGWLVDRPRLAVVITVDQLRADYLSRFRPGFLPAVDAEGAPGGLAWLLDRGAWYPWGDHDVFQASTGPGHATILSGSWPSTSGIALNGWWDASAGQERYCARQPDGVLGPGNFSGTTVGDELKETGAPSKVVSLALKDRAAILLGGRRPDAAVWFDATSSAWTTSAYYGEVPAWAQAESARIPKGTQWRWTVEGRGTGLSGHGERDGWSRTFAVGDKALLATPWGMERTVDLAVAALDGAELGRDASPDLLALSFSSTDLVGHATGPNSREMEAMVMALDVAIARLLREVDRRVPLSEVVVVLTGDHGAPANPDWATAEGRPARRVAEKEARARVESALTARFGAPKGGAWIAWDGDFQYAFAPAALAGHDPVALEEVARAALLEVPGIATVFTATDVREGRLRGDLARRVSHQWRPDRGGAVVAIPEPGTMRDGDPVSHVTGYSYDRLVPIVLAGPHVRPGLRAEHADIVDIAPTLAFLLGVLPPDRNEGRVLAESLDVR